MKKKVTRTGSPSATNSLKNISKRSPKPANKTGKGKMVYPNGKN